MGLALVPPMYAWFTTLGFWDPYSNTGNIKVAVASEDAGYTSDLIPTPINAGEQIIGKLRANDQFAWQFVSADEAVHGVRSGEYYAALVIPKEFSRDLMTVFYRRHHRTEDHLLRQREGERHRPACDGDRREHPAGDHRRDVHGNRGIGGPGHHEQPHFVHERGRHPHLRANPGVAPWRGRGRSRSGGRSGSGLRRSHGIHDLARERDGEHSEGGGEGARRYRSSGERGTRGPDERPGRAFRREHRSREGAHRGRCQLRRRGPRRR